MELTHGSSDCANLFLFICFVVVVVVGVCVCVMVVTIHRDGDDHCTV